MKPHLDPHISGTEQYRALKITIPKEKFIKNYNIILYCDIFNTSWVIATQTLVK